MPLTVESLSWLSTPLSSALYVDLVLHPYVLKSEALCELRAASRAYSSKCAKYSEVCSLSGLKFLPVTFESTGKPHPVTGCFFNTAMNMMSDGMSFESKSISNFYWSARLSCCLHKSMAQTLLRKYSSCNGKAVHGLHFSHSNRSNMIARDLATLHCNYPDSWCLMWTCLESVTIVVLVLSHALAKMEVLLLLLLLL